MEDIDLNTIIQEVIALQRVSIENKGLKFNIPTFDEPIMVHVDAQRLRQVLLNIVGNSVKFTEQGSITIDVKVHQSQVKIQVIDTGVGIDPSQQSKLFRPFVMADGTTTRKFGGTGLGLSISKNLLEIMGGNISLCSQGIGKGTTIEIVLPILGSCVSPQLNGHNHKMVELS